MAIRIQIWHFYPERLAWIGAGLLLGASLFALSFFAMFQESSPSILIRRDKTESSPPSAPYFFSLDLSADLPRFSLPDLRGKMIFAFDPPRPTGASVEKRLLVRMGETSESRRVVLPCRLDLEFQGHQLKFAKENSPFWIDLAELPNGHIEAKGWILTPDGTKIDAGVFQSAGQDSPLQSAQEFAEHSPFRILAEAKWWGKDLLRQSESGERIEIGELLEISQGDWLIWDEGKWQKGGQPSQNRPIARIKSVSPKMLILEAWDMSEHTRIGLNFNAPTPLKMRAEELLSAVRVRSDKQISCMLEKQCMVLRTGDWVLKMGPRWKVLRKKDEKDAFLNGKLSGELFILDLIFQKQGQKMIQGRLFNPGRTQVHAVEMSATLGRKSQRMGGKH